MAALQVSRKEPDSAGLRCLWRHDESRRCAFRLECCMFFQSSFGPCGMTGVSYQVMKCSDSQLPCFAYHASRPTLNYSIRQRPVHDRERTPRDMIAASSNHIMNKNYKALAKADGRSRAHADVRHDKFKFRERSCICIGYRVRNLHLPL